MILLYTSGRLLEFHRYKTFCTFPNVEVCMHIRSICYNLPLVIVYIDRIHQ